MTHKQVYKVTDNQLIITLPEIFRNKSVTVTIDDEVNKNKDNIALMKQAANDPMYLRDLKEVNEDFEGIEFETL